MFSVIFTNFHIVLNVDSDVFTVLFHNLCNELKKNSNRACMPRGNTDSTLNQAYADDPKAGTKNLSEDQIKSFIAGLVSSKKSETQLQSDIRNLSTVSSDRCVQYIKRRTIVAQSSTRETQIKSLIDAHIVSC